MIFKYFLFSGVILLKFGLVQAKVSSDSFSDKIKTNLLVKAENKKAEQTALTDTRLPASSIKDSIAQAEANQQAEFQSADSLSVSKRIESKTQGVILKFSKWPVVEEKSIKDKLKKAELEESLKIERFKVWVYKWKSTRSVVENEDLCSNFTGFSSVQSCELDLLLEPAQTKKSSSDSPETFNLKTCNILSSQFNLNKYPHLKDRAGVLSDYWAQEMVGADLLKKQIESADSAKKPTVELFDSNKQNKHDELVKNIISGDGRSSVLPSLADNIGVSQSNTVSDLLRHSDAFLNKMDKVCADSKANQKVSSGQAGGTSGGSSGQGQKAGGTSGGSSGQGQKAGGTSQVGAGTGGTSQVGAGTGGTSQVGAGTGGTSQVGAGIGGASDDSSEQRQTASLKSGGSSDLVPSSQKQKQKERTKEGSGGQIQTNTGIDWETPYWKLRLQGGDAEMMRVYTARWEAILGVNNPFPSNPYWVSAWEKKSGGSASVMSLTYNGVSGYNAVDPQTGNTVLHVFSAIGSHHNVAMLRQFGVDEKARNKKGQQAWELWGVISTTLGEPDNTDYKEEMRKAAGGGNLEGQGAVGSITGNLVTQGQTATSDLTPDSQKQSESLSALGITDSNQIDWVATIKRVLWNKGHENMTIDELIELKALANKHNRQKLALRLNGIIISRTQKIEEEQTKQEEQQQKQEQESERKKRAQDTNLAWQNLTAKQIWAKMKDLSITTWKHMTYEELQVKAKSASAKWDERPREWDIVKQRAVNNAWSQQIRLRFTADEAEEAREYAKKSHKFYALSAPKISAYVPAFYKNPPLFGLEIKRDSYTPLPIIQHAQVVPGSYGLKGKLFYNSDQNLMNFPGGRGFRFGLRVLYLSKSGNWHPYFSDGHGLGDTKPPSFVTEKTTWKNQERDRSEMSSWGNIGVNAKGGFTVKFYFNYGEVTSENEVVFEFDSKGNQISRTINKR